MCEGIPDSRVSQLCITSTHNLSKTMNEAIQALHPPRPTAFRRRIRRSSSQDITTDIASLSISSPKRSSSFQQASSTRHKYNPRFTELLLEHGETQLGDWAVCVSSSSGSRGKMSQTEGRLRLCSRSIVFEPRHSSKGIVRIPFRFMTMCPSLIETGLSGLKNPPVLAISTDRHLVMKANNAVGPYEQIQVSTDFRFTFLHSSPSSVLSIGKMLYDSEKKSSTVKFDPGIVEDQGGVNFIQSSHSIDHNSVLQQILSNPIDVSLGPAHFLHINERPLSSQMKCTIKQPLQEQVGVALLTNYGIYFQQWNGVALPKPQNFLSINDMKAIARRYDGLKDVGLEFYLAKREGSDDKCMHHSILLSFESVQAREGVIRILLSQRQDLPFPCFTDKSFVESAMQQWLAGELDNFSYLLILNAAAGRSFHDLSRYPVFPWVLSNYGENEQYESEKNFYLDLSNPENYRDLSKPIGSLNEERFIEFQKRYDGMVQQQKSMQNQGHKLHHTDSPFMYGTHYSSSGYVLFYLLRVMPEHMLCLQNGNFVCSIIFPTYHEVLQVNTISICSLRKI